jgi:signal peptidase I
VPIQSEEFLTVFSEAGEAIAFLMQTTVQVHEYHKIDMAASVLRAGKRIRLRVFGTSMLPSLWPGDILTVEPGEELVPGDIVLFLRDGRFCAHRLLVQSGRYWVTRGDAMRQDDPPVEAGELLGRVGCISRGNRSVVPRRRVSLVGFALAWMLCRSERFCNFMLRIHAARLRVFPPPASQSVCGKFAAVREITGISSSPSPLS